jgi:release factor glutamine methyltransferase
VPSWAVPRIVDTPHGHPLILHERVTHATRTLMAAGYSEAEAAIDAEVLARHTLGWTREQMLVRWRDPEPREFAFPYAALIERRRRHEPVAYITGHREFWNLEMAVTRDTLIPRPETELIVEETLALLASRAAETSHAPDDVAHASGERDALTIVDVGTRYRMRA